MIAIVCIIIAYLLGSLSAAILLAKITNMPDPRSVGSKNAGATNVLRTAGKHQAFVVLLGDIAKGVVAVLIARLFGLEGFSLGLVATASVLGHIFPVFFKFKGGKGVATALGALIALSFWMAIVCAIIWGLMLAIFRYSSLASLTAIAASPFLLLFFSDSGYFVPQLITAGFVLYFHRANIERLRNKTEPKVQF